MKTIWIADPEYPGGLGMREGTFMDLELGETWYVPRKIICFSPDPSSVEHFDEIVQMMVDEYGTD